jgi:hypothetical protein
MNGRLFQFVCKFSPLSACQSPFVIDLFDGLLGHDPLGPDALSANPSPQLNTRYDEWYLRGLYTPS